MKIKSKFKVSAVLWHPSLFEGRQNFDTLTQIKMATKWHKYCLEILTAVVAPPMGATIDIIMSGPHPIQHDWCKPTKVCVKWHIAMCSCMARIHQPTNDAATLTAVRTLATLMPHLHQDTCCPEKCIPDEQLVSRYIHVAGYMLLVRDTG